MPLHRGGTGHFVNHMRRRGSARSGVIGGFRVLRKSRPQTRGTRHLVHFDGIHRRPRPLEGVHVNDPWAREWAAHVIEHAVVEVPLHLVDGEAVRFGDVPTPRVQVSHERPVPVVVHDLHDLAPLHAQLIADRRRKTLQNDGESRPSVVGESAIVDTLLEFPHTAHPRFARTLLLGGGVTKPRHLGARSTCDSMML